MDTKRFIIAMALSFLLIFGWQQAVFYLDKTHPEWHLIAKPTTQPTTAPTAVNTGAVPTPTTVPTTLPAGITVQSGQTSSPINLGSAVASDPNYAMQVVVSPTGAGINDVTLNDYKKEVRSDARYSFQQPIESEADNTRPLSTQWVTINGQKINLAATNWTLQNSSANSATFATTINGEKGHIATITKTYTLAPRSDRSGGFEVRLTYGIANHTAQPLSVQSEFAGPVMPPRELDRGQDRGFVTGNLDIDRIAIVRHYIEEFTTEKQTIDLNPTSNQPNMWFGASSVYFSAFIRPDPTETGKWAPNYIDKIQARVINPTAAANDRLSATSFETTALTIQANQKLELPFRLFFGPKRRGVVDNAYYSQLPFEYNRALVVSGGCCGFLTFQPVINVLVWLLQIFHFVLRDWGLAIIALVILVRGILHPITKKSQINMVKMGKMGPEIEKLKKKYGDDKEGLNRAMMEFYKEQGATPILGCLPMFLQMPIWVALWSALQSTFELRHAPFLYFFGHHFTWIYDLAKPDNLVTFTPVPLPFGITINAINLLPILMGVVFWINQKYTPRPPATTPEQEQQQKMMQWMSLLFPVFLYNGPAGLNLYIFTSTLMGIGESKIIRDHIKEREEAEKEGRVFVPAKTRRKQPKQGAPEKKGGWLANKLAELQSRAEQIQREQEKKKKKD